MGASFSGSSDGAAMLSRDVRAQMQAVTTTRTTAQSSRVGRRLDSTKEEED